MLELAKTPTLAPTSLIQLSMHVSGKKFLFLLCFSFQIGDILLTSNTARLAVWVALVLIGCITVAGNSRGLKGNSRKPCFLSHPLISSITSTLRTDVKKHVYLDSY